MPADTNNLPDPGESDDGATRIVIAPPAPPPPPPAVEAVTRAATLVPAADSNATTTELPVGTVLSNTLEIVRLIGSGGMGQVYLAKHTFQGTMHAIKRIAPHIARDPTYLDLFKREAQVLVKLRSDSIVRYDMSFIDADGSAYLVMEFLDGPSLGAHVKANGPMSPEDLSVLGQRVAAGLKSAHDQAVYHRDIAPDNVLLHGGIVAGSKIIDFGIAREDRGTEATILGGSFAGKPRYASPEQFHLFGGKIDGRSDIYSLGLVFAFALLGRPLLDATNEFDARDQRKEPPDLSAIPSEFRPVLARMLVPDPAERAQTMDDVIALLKEHVDKVPPAPLHAMAGPAPKASAGRLMPLILAGVVALIVLAGAIVAVLLTGQGSSPETLASGAPAAGGQGTRSAPGTDYSPLWTALTEINGASEWSLFVLTRAEPKSLAFTHHHLGPEPDVGDRQRLQDRLGLAEAFAGHTVSFDAVGLPAETAALLKSLHSAFDGALSRRLHASNLEGGPGGVNVAGLYVAAPTELFQAKLSVDKGNPILVYGNFLFPNGDLLHEWMDSDIKAAGPGFFLGDADLNDMKIPWPLSPNYDNRRDSQAVLVDHGQGLAATIVLAASIDEGINDECLEGRLLPRSTIAQNVPGRIQLLIDCAAKIKSAGGDVGIAIRPFLSMTQESASALPGYVEARSSRF